MPEWISYYAGLIAKGLQTTLSLLLISAVLGFALAVLVALARLSRRKWLARGALAYTSVLRGTPLLIQIYIFYYGLGSLFAQFPMLRASHLRRDNRAKATSTARPKPSTAERASSDKVVCKPLAINAA